MSEAMSNRVSEIAKFWERSGGKWEQFSDQGALGTALAHIPELVEQYRDQRTLLLKVKELAVVLKTDEPNDWMDRLNEIAAEVDGVE